MGLGTTIFEPPADGVGKSKVPAMGSGVTVRLRIPAIVGTGWVAVVAI
jgi:hypothetical protein